MAGNWVDPEATAKLMASYLRLPFASESVPGAFAEVVIEQQYGGKVLRTYDFADVIAPEMKVGWQVKSTKATTPVTWKRAKIPNALELIEASRAGDAGLQALGDAVISFCNEHAEASLKLYKLDEIRYARVICTPTRLTFFERVLVTKEQPVLFNPKDFRWSWSVKKQTKGKEQLQALHGIGPGGTKWFAAHLLGENQLHFSGESVWWPKVGDSRRADINIGEGGSLITWEKFFEWVSSA